MQCPLLLATTLALGMSACGDVRVRWRDPEVSLAHDAGGTHGPKSLQLGFGQGEEFVPLDEVPVQVVVPGLQGGTWTMPTLRAETLAATLALECRLTTTIGELLGETRVTTSTRPAKPGWVEVALLPIPVSHAPPNGRSPITDLDGVAASFECSATAAGATADAKYAVTLDVR